MTDDKTFGEIAISVLIGLLMALVFGFVVFNYVKTTQDITEDDIRQNINEIEAQCVNLLRERINNNKIYIESIANSIAIRNERILDIGVLSILKNKTQYSFFDGINVINYKGQALNEEGNVLYTIDAAEYFSVIKSGKTYINTRIIPEISDKELMIIIAPVFKDSQFEGSVAGYYYIEHINQVITLDVFGGLGFGYMSKSTGEVFAASNHSDADETFKDLKTDFYDWQINDNDLQKMLSNMKNGQNGEVVYGIEGTERMMSYTPVGINDWYLLTVVPKAVIDIRSRRMLRETLKLITAIATITSIGVAYAFYMQKKSKKRLEESKQRYEIVMEQTQDIVFEWSVNDSKIYHSKNFLKKFGYDPGRESFPQIALDKAIIYPEDIVKFLDIFKGIEDGKKYIVTQIRIKKDDGNFIWCRVCTTTIFDDFDQPYRGIGIISDIDEQVNNLIAIENSARIDPLTKLYNRMHTQEYINKYLAETDSPAAIMVIDIDDFKNINDTLGHAYGDKALSAIAQSLQDIFYDGIVGRFGGDEFVVFMEGTYDDNLHKRLLDSITVCERSIVDKEIKCKISVSIGIALYPKDGKAYSELFEKADISLYYAKNHGKNRYAVFSEKLAEQSMLAQYSKK